MCDERVPEEMKGVAGCCCCWFRSSGSAKRQEAELEVLRFSLGGMRMDQIRKESIR